MSLSSIANPVENKSWYAVYTIVRHEKTVNSSLVEKDIESYLPLKKTISRWKDRKKKVYFPLFPGYVFVNIDISHKLSVLKIPGVVHILGISGNPTPIPYEQIESIKTLLESDLSFVDYPYLVEGNEVIVVNGILQGVRGRVVERRGEHKLILSVDLIKRSVSLELDINDVEPI